MPSPRLRSATSSNSAIRPFRRLHRSVGMRCPCHSRSSDVSGARSIPRRIAGVRPSSPVWTKWFTARKIVRYFPSIWRSYGANPCQTALWLLKVLPASAPPSSRTSILLSLRLDALELTGRPCRRQLLALDVGHDIVSIMNLHTDADDRYRVTRMPDGDRRLLDCDGAVISFNDIIYDLPGWAKMRTRDLVAHKSPEQPTDT